MPIRRPGTTIMPSTRSRLYSKRLLLRNPHLILGQLNGNRVINLPHPLRRVRPNLITPNRDCIPLWRNDDMVRVVADSDILVVIARLGGCVAGARPGVLRPGRAAGTARVSCAMVPAATTAAW